MTPRARRILEAAGVCLVLVLAAWLRLRDAAFVAFNRDAGLLVSMADRLRAGEPILLGIPSSKGIANPPLAIYFVAAIESVARSPHGITVVMALMQVAAIAATWLAVRRRLGPGIAFATAALFATSGWAVLYARILWPPCFAPLLSIAMLACLWAWTIERRPWALAAALALSAAVSQLHLTGFAWFAIVVAVAALFRPPIRRGPLVAGALSVVLLFLPFAIGMATQGVAAGTKRRALFVDPMGSPARFFLLSATHSGIDYHFPMIDTDLTASASLATVAGIVPWIAAALVAAGFFLCAPRRRDFVRTPEFPWIRCTAEPRTAIPVLFAAIPIGAMVATGLATSAHYLILEFPTAWIFLAVACERLATRSRRARVVAAGLAASIVATGVWFTLALQGWIETRPPWNWSAGYSTPLGDQEAAIDWIAGDAGTSPVRLLGTPRGEPGDPSTRPPFNLAWLLAHRRGELVRVSDLEQPIPAGTRKYLVVDESNGGLSASARASLQSKGAHRFGAMWVLPWE